MSKTWGTPTWIFFHTLAETISDDYYNKNKKQIIDIIKTICCNLPCRDCTEHAKKYLKRISYNSLATKQDFKMMLINFHNSVNQRKRRPIFTDYDKYKNGDLLKSYNDFRIQYLSNHTLNRGFIFTMSRRNSIKNIDTFIKNILGL